MFIHYLNKIKKTIFKIYLKFSRSQIDLDAIKILTGGTIMKNYFNSEEKRRCKQNRCKNLSE